MSAKWDVDQPLPGTVQVRTETNLGAMLRTFMAVERWSMRKLAPQIGISPATLHRVCAGYDMDADTLLKVINWMTRART